MILLTIIWSEILKRVDQTRQTLQKQELDLFDATNELQALSMFLCEKMSYFDDYKAKTLKLAMRFFIAMRGSENVLCFHLKTETQTMNK